MTKRTFTTAEVAQITGFSIRQLDYWARQDLIVPSAQSAHGSGSRRFYNIEDLLQLRFIRQLKQQGCSTQKIRIAVETLRTVIEDPDPLKNTVVVYRNGLLLALCKTRAGERVMLDALSRAG